MFCDSGIFPSKITEGREKKSFYALFIPTSLLLILHRIEIRCINLLIKRGIRGCLCMNCMSGILHSIFLLSHSEQTWEAPGSHLAAGAGQEVLSSCKASSAPSVGKFANGKTLKELSSALPRFFFFQNWY